MDLQGIVRRLNGAPFNMKLTLVELDSQDQSAVCQLLSDIFAVLNPVHKKNVREETESQTALRLLDMITVLNYRHNMDPKEFRSGLMGGNRDVLYPLLMWMLGRWEEIEKRAHLAKYLRPVPIPQEMFLDKDIQELHTLYRARMDTFKQVHKELDSVKSDETRKDPSVLSQEIADMRSEKEQLSNKLERLQIQVESDEYAESDFEPIFALTSSLRKEQEEEAQLQESLHNQRQMLSASVRRYQQLTAKMNSLANSDINQQTAKDLLDKLRKQVSSQRFLADVELPKEIDKVRAKSLEVQAMLAEEPMTEEHVDQIENQVHELNQKIHQLRQKRDEIHAQTDSKLSFYRTRAAGVARKKEQAQEKLDEAQEEKEELEEEIRKLDEEAASLLVNGKKPMSDKQLNQYLESLKSKTRQYKQLKAQLQEIKNEMGVLMRTDDILSSRAENLQEFLEEQERQEGVVGFGAAASKLEGVSEQTASINRGKQETLDGMSTLVKQVDTKLKEKKGKLAPLIKQLRVVRNEYNEVKKQYVEKKKVYENTKIGLDAERLQLESQVQDNEQAAMAEEGKYHMIHCLMKIQKAHNDKVTSEIVYQRGDSRLNSTHATHREAYEAEIRELESKSKDLRKEKGIVENTHGKNTQQRSEFNKLVSLLNAKFQSSQQMQSEEAEENRVFQGETDLDGANRMVLED